MIEAKPELLQTPPAHHGAFDFDELARLGFSPDEVTDFSVNSNPYGPPPGVREAIAAVPLERYPDRECLVLRHRLADLHGIGMEQIVVGNGTAEMFQLIAFAFLERSAPVLIPAATFGEYTRAAQLVGARITTWNFDHEPDWSDIRLAFLCNPNNPTGTLLSLDRITAWARQHPGVLFVIDEAYSNFLEAPESMLKAACPNVLIVRSMTKDYALAGLRLGYLVGEPVLIEAVRRVRPAWNVNALAQAAGIAALDTSDWLNQTVTRLHADKRELVAGLAALSLVTLPSVTHYFLVDAGNGAAFRTKLLHHRIMVRDCASFGLPQYVRISTHKPDDNRRLIAAVAQVLA